MSYIGFDCCNSTGGDTVDGGDSGGAEAIDGGGRRVPIISCQLISSYVLTSLACGIPSLALMRLVPSSVTNCSLFIFFRFWRNKLPVSSYTSDTWMKLTISWTLLITIVVSEKCICRSSKLSTNLKKSLIPRICHRKNLTYRQI